MLYIDYVEVKFLVGFFLKRDIKIQCMEETEILKKINLRMTLFNTPEMDIWENLEKN